MAIGLHRAHDTSHKWAHLSCLLTKHLTHFLDGPGPSSWPNQIASTILRSRNNALREFIYQEIIGVWCKFQESHVNHK